MDVATAISLGGKTVQAEDCDYTSYWRLGLRCIECGEPVHLRQGFSIRPHFAHFPLVRGRKAEYCSLRLKSESASYCINQLAKSKGQRLETFQKFFLSMMATGFERSSLWRQGLFSETEEESFISQAQEIENSFASEIKELKENSINLFLSQQGKVLVMLNSVYADLGMTGNQFLHTKEIIREVLAYLKVVSSRQNLSLLITKIIHLLQTDGSIRKKVDLRYDQEITAFHVQKALIYTLVSIDWVFLTDQASQYIYFSQFETCDPFADLFQE